MRKKLLATRKLLKEELKEGQVSPKPCPRCLPLAQEGKIRAETVQPLPKGAMAPLARDGSGKCCHDCAAADTLVGLQLGLTFVMARVAVGNDRQEQLRLPGTPMGYVGQGIMRPNEPGDLDRHFDWLEEQGVYVSTTTPGQSNNRWIDGG